jgi:hypothetical protein
VQIPGVIPGLRLALTLGILLLLTVVCIAVLRVTFAARDSLACVLDFAETPLARRLPSATVSLLC